MYLFNHTITLHGNTGVCGTMKKNMSEDTRKNVKTKLTDIMNILLME